MKIVSGGQTGVDRAALDAAMSLGVDCGGWCPEGRLDETGRIPAHYPLRELPGGGYLERTAQNVRDSDGTVVFYRETLQGGTKATADFCAAERKPHLLIDAANVSPEESARHLKGFVRANQVEVLNVAGPRASQWPPGYEFAFQTLTQFIRGGAPKLSFVIPAHNEEHELPQTLRALRRAVDAAGEPFELIVVDDASTDATAEIARSFGARVISIERRQIAASRNAGAHAARGDILFFVDADTHIAPGHVTGALAALAQGCIGGGARVEMEGRLPLFTRILVRVFCVVYFGTGFGAGAFLFTRRADFEGAGGFDEQYFAGEEIYFSLALRKRGRFKILREPVITSARKLRMHRPGVLLGQTFFILLGGRGALRTRDRLALWYDGKRERPAI
ncbi:MAG TPA: putative molybdenum carrier protein [Chthoniobacterales bacterium]